MAMAMAMQVSPVDFGADPSGAADSAHAFDAVVAHMLTLGGGRRNGARPEAHRRARIPESVNL